MTHATDSFKTSDGLTLHTESWLADGTAKAVVIIVHGLGEHIGRYAHVAARLNKEGYSVYGLDHRGHGKSEGAVRAYFENFEQPVNDLAHYVTQVQTANPGKKLFMYGHSLGSLITLSYALKHQRELAGLIISGTPLEVEGSQPALLIQAGSVMNAIVPKMAITPLPPEGLSHDPAVVNGYRNDPLVYHGNVRVRMGTDIVQVSRKIKAGMKNLTIPIFIIHGEKDPICPVKGSRTLHAGVGSQDKTLKIYADLFHEIHNEPEQQEVFDDIVAWLNSH